MFGIRIENETLVYDDQLEQLVPRAGEVLIKVAYTAINRADLFQMQGSYPAPEGASPLPGLEVSGTIAALGEGVSNYNIDDEVCALLEGGGYAQYTRVAATQTFPIPKGWNLREAGALPEGLFTIWLALFHTAHVTAGETVLIHGGASGIGSLASQMVAAAGATAITTASSAEKCQFSETYGAAKSYSYKESDFVEALKTHHGGVDVVLDMIGGDYFQKNLKCLKRGGRMVSIAFLRGAKAELNMAPLLLKQISWHGLTLRSRSTKEKAILAQEIREHCWDWLENRQVIPAIDSEYPLSQAGKAIKKIEQNLNLGKILLKA
ncbi:MAG: NAD(P)H-quinone oxidoreductase [Rickettsiales bacterium]|nr:NAD(P)H-quinone oxidoreductase [Rickettsiales bacterium]